MWDYSVNDLQRVKWFVDGCRALALDEVARCEKNGHGSHKEFLFQLECAVNAERRIMAKAGGKAPTRDNGTWKGFINRRMSDEDWVRFNTWELDPADVTDLIGQMISSGYKLTCSYVKENDNFCVSVTCTNDKDPNAGYTMTSFAPTWFDGMRVAAFKHFVLMECNWNAQAAQTMAKWG